MADKKKLSPLQEALAENQKATLDRLTIECEQRKQSESRLVEAVEIRDKLIETLRAEKFSLVHALEILALEVGVLAGTGKRFSAIEAQALFDRKAGIVKAKAATAEYAVAK